ncbi:hypothetical protein STAFG_0214 [Streptomyces afghaniensis 772]|uniref:Uncharacterized protein n=1 Tax=Streptomyces afghaniensis 772 TaxID=1283301 RepID=S4MZL6_9ACTN|nr:hypothetical protein [Streptomyces afghaniensis]EPJ42721.1 hypothetical protein STAFG_0214 [Streptomyces afghaniensis 772]
MVRGRGLRRLLDRRDGYHDGFDAFVNQVIPILQERGLVHDDYEGPTLRENLGAHEQYGLDPRLTKPAPVMTTTPQVLATPWPPR